MFPYIMTIWCMSYIMMWNMIVDSLWGQILDEVIHIYYDSIIVSFSVIYSMCTLVYKYNILMEYAYDAEITLIFHYASLC